MTYIANKDQEPLHDGRYLCVVRVQQPCGATWHIERIVEREMGRWVLGDGGNVVEWMALPYGGQVFYPEGL